MKLQPRAEKGRYNFMSEGRYMNHIFKEMAVLVTNTQTNTDMLLVFTFTDNEKSSLVFSRNLEPGKRYWMTSITIAYPEAKKLPGRWQLLQDYDGILLKEMNPVDSKKENLSFIIYDGSRFQFYSWE